MAGNYELKKASNGRFMFNLKAGNGEVVLTSALYTTKQSAENGIKSVRTHSPVDSAYERKASKAGEAYFVLKALNHEVIGKSQMYSSKAAMEKGIQAVKENGRSATEDLT